MPARLRDLVATLRTMGVEVETPKSGSHFVARKPGCRPYPIPAHNGLKSEIEDKYIRALCRNFGIDPAALKPS
jgi:hypothetical protein